ncbi:aminopeptidase [Halobellus captivus]|uniref:aminopeptidase n=1 Tax=Halobellus captivus TaxID=2592614 RepID=UPI0011A1996D|nr:hypothetical protein [Halobellus captivus]
MTVREAEMIENAKKPFEYNAEDGDDIVIVSDTGMDPTVWSVLNKAARSLGHKPTVVVMPQSEYSHAEPPRPVTDAMLGADLILMATSKGLGHSDAGSEVIGAGKKVILMSEITPETLASGAAAADYDEIKRTGDKVKQKWDAGSTVKITSDAGTDLVADISGQQASVHAARCDEGNDQLEDDDHSSVRICAFPDGESPITPVFGTTNGTIVWDTTMHEIGAIDDPIHAEVEDGFVTEITGGHEARKLRAFLDQFDDPNVYNIGEISVNTNPGAEITGRLREDKKASGYLHIAVGSGGDVDAAVHIDGVLGGATLLIDDEVIVQDGEIALE